MKQRHDPLISPAEMQALMGEDRLGSFDAYFPLRVWYLMGTCSLYALRLIFSSQHMARLLATDLSLPDRHQRFNLLLPLRHPNCLDRRTS
jgi:hypothetical protein